MAIIAAGVGSNKNIITAAQKINFEVILVEKEELMLDMIRKNTADAYVRGSLNASSVMKYLRSIFPSKINRASFIEIDDFNFLLAPVGIDEGRDLSEKLILVEQCCEFLLKIGKSPKIAIISGGRPQDFGRDPKIDDSINQGEELTKILKNKYSGTGKNDSITKNKYSINHYYILIENAVKDGCNLILAPDGISGNLIFRSLVLLGSGKSNGAITLGIDPLFIDTSRAQSVEGYMRALNFAHYLATLNKKEK
ncbi:methanogenesis marker protein Mmp4/MtxX [Methanobacterium alcaliphilum]|uniref:methanogenesis marker protein Mmp4/MtxX n=1 Tax=Methanobacterium alcaliphilum TaxID=392018 RepID=UPI00200A0538|nr:methanogenesis marker protein Mmp4/MtxX [Methanobacterium alcaliphilum]MCK9152505.1 methanogenesis marker protein Mmp4/MtxX [Methanobacterium alcaliphilum]